MPEVTGQAKLAVHRDKIDFGTVLLGKTVQATFKLMNVGDKPLQIQGQPAIQVLKASWMPGPGTLPIRAAGRREARCGQALIGHLTPLTCDCCAPTPRRLM